jgi:hypothetical protein
MEDFIYKPALKFLSSNGPPSSVLFSNSTGLALP